jgi:hypothetical protein
LWDPPDRWLRDFWGTPLEGLWPLPEHQKILLETCLRVQGPCEGSKESKREPDEKNSVISKNSKVLQNGLSLALNMV